MQSTINKNTHKFYEFHKLQKKRLWLMGVLLFVVSYTNLFAEMIDIPGGSFRPFDIKKGDKPVQIKRFMIDKAPVSVADYTLFLEKNPEWNKQNVSLIKADKGYLSHIALSLSKTNVAVTQVSWFAARAYCKVQNKRLPTMYEWEYIATYHQWDQSASVNDRILKWFAEPNDFNKPIMIGTGLVSPQGIIDLHGLIWEWVEDFNSSTITGDSRADTTAETNLFCGASALSGSDLRNYTAYMRYATRSSLKGSYTGYNIGFRCAKDATNRKGVQ